MGQYFLWWYINNVQTTKMFHFYPNMNAYTSKTRIQFGPNDYDMYSEYSNNEDISTNSANSTKLKEVNIAPLTNVPTNEMSVTVHEKPPQAGGTNEHVVEPQLNRS